MFLKTCTFVLSAVLTAGLTCVAQDPPPARDTTKVNKPGEPDVTYGRVKELTAGQKIVIDVDNQVDKNFDLTDKDTKVNIAKGLKVGDPVKVTERDRKGKKEVVIAKHTGGGVKHGDADRTTTDKKK